MDKHKFYGYTRTEVVTAVIVLCGFLFTIGFGVGSATTFKTYVPYAEECSDVVERSYFDGNKWVIVWNIYGTDYLVRDGEILGRYERFYTEDGGVR